MKIATISKKLIKPYTPTPPNLKNYYLSLIDQIVSETIVSVVFFYKSKPEKKLQLEESLAKILVQFYPLAGRYMKNDHLVDCSDQGALFVEAEALDVELTMDLVLKNMEIHKLQNLFPDRDLPSDASNPLLSIQVTHFPCGGVAITISVSHKVFDGQSFGTFFAAWSNATNPNRKVAFTPSFALPSLLPYKDGDFGVNIEGESTGKDGNIVIKRFLFDKVAITRLRSKLSPNRNGKTISRMRVVSAVIAKTLIGLDRAKHGKTRNFVISHPVNMRQKTITPLPEHACGNFAIPSLTLPMVASEGKEIGMQELVDLMGDAIEQTIADYSEILSPDRDGRDIIIHYLDDFIKINSNPETNIIRLVDWTKLGLYDVDLGWGDPVLVSVGPSPLNNYAILISNKEGDGIEAWLYLGQDDMNYFEQGLGINYLTSKI